MYEAILYCKPIVVQNGTFVADRVAEYKCGYAINAYNDEEIEEFIRTLSRNDMLTISKTELQVETSELIDNPAAIIERVKSIAVLSRRSLKVSEYDN